MESNLEFGQSILIIDDEEGFRDFFQYALEPWGFAITTCESGLEGLKHLEKTPVDLVLLDACLNGMSGMETLRQIRRKHPSLAVVILSFISDSVEIDALSLGAVACQQKPTTNEELIALVREAIGENTEKTQV